MRVGPHHILRDPNFRTLWIGQFLSAIGDPILPFAVALMALERGDEPISVALVFGARALASTLTVLVGGVLADRFSRKRVMIACDLVRIASILAIVAAPESMPIWALSACVFVFGIAESIFRPAYSALVPSLVGEQIQAANALTSLTRSLAGLAGPALAGILVTFFSARGALAVDAATFAASVASLVLVREPTFRPDQSDSPTWFLSDIRAGFAAVASRRWIAIEIAVAAVQISLSVAPWLVLLPVVAADHLGGPGAYAALLTTMSAGAVVGALVGARIRTSNPGIVASLGLLPFSAAVAGLAFSWPLPALLLVQFAAGFGIEVYSILWYTAIQRSVPAALLGRVFAVDQLGSLALLPIAMMVTGLLVDRGSEGPILLIAAIVNIATSIVPLALRDVRAFGEMAAKTRAVNVMSPGDGL